MNVKLFNTRYFSVLILLSILLFGVSGLSAAQKEPSVLFVKGIDAYHADKFDQAIAAFKSICDAGIQNGKLYYNLGNAYLKKDEIGQAILWYEKAKILLPNDPDLKFNLEYAQSLIKDEPGQKTNPVLKVIFFWKHRLSRITIQLLAIIINVIFWFTLAIKLVIKKNGFRYPLVFLLCFNVVFTLTAFYNYYEQYAIKKGIVLPAEISVRSGLTKESTELFILHTGTRVIIEREQGDFIRIYYTTGKIGWVPKSEIGII